MACFRHIFVGCFACPRPGEPGLEDPELVLHGATPWHWVRSDWHSGCHHSEPFVHRPLYLLAAETVGPLGPS